MKKTYLIAKLKSDKLLVIVILISWLLSFWFMSGTFAYRDHQFFIDSKLWSDFAAHIPLIRSFSLGHNFPPQYPTFPGEPIRYHYLFYALVGLTEKAGFDLAFALNFFTALGTSLLLTMIFVIARRLFTPSAGILAPILFLFNGSLTFIDFFRRYPLKPSSLTDILTATNFTNFGPWNGDLISAFWNLNIYTNQRHLALGFGLMLLGLYPLISWSRTPSRPLKFHPAYMLIPLFLPLIHQAAFMAYLVVVLILLVLNFNHLPKIRSSIFLLMAATPGFIYLMSGSSSGQVQFFLGFLAPQSSLTGILNYWFHNLGLYLILFPLLIIRFDPPGRRILLAFFSLFILANLFRFSPDIINNHKLVNLFTICLNIFTAGWIVRQWRHRSRLKLIIPLLLISLTLSGFIDLFPILNDHTLTVDDIPRNQTATWINSHTPPQSIFLTTTYLYNPASLAGRKTWLDYGYFNWSLGYNDQVRKSLLPLLFSPTADMSRICALLTKSHIDYIFIDRRQGDIPNVDPHRSVIAVLHHPQHTSSQGDRIYQVDNLCPNH